jgi:hypothetical protein
MLGRSNRSLGPGALAAALSRRERSSHPASLKNYESV